MIRVFLNNIQTQQPPIEMDSIQEELLLSFEAKGYVFQINGSVTFVNSDYEYLRSLYDNDFCQDVSIIIQQSMDFGNTWQSKIKGLIKLVDITWKPMERQAECTIIDNSYIAKINNNRQIDFQLGNYKGIVLSKNGIDVSYKVNYSLTNLFSPFRGRYFTQESNYTTTSPPFPVSTGDLLVDLRPTPRPGMFIWDVFNLLIAMLTDDEVDFKSDLFDISGGIASANEEAVAKIFTGQCLRSGSGYPVLNFEQWFRDMHKLTNCWFGFEISTSGKPVFRVEHEDYFRQSNSNMYFDSVKTFSEAIDVGKIYSKVIVGCSVSSNGNFPVGQIPLIMHAQEEFPLSGTCNENNELDLRLEKLIISTNAISEALPSISGFSNGGAAKRKYTSEETTAGVGGENQLLIDTSAPAKFIESLIRPKFLIENLRSGEWSYITGLPGDDKILIKDILFPVDNTGAIKEYEIFKPSENTQYPEEVFLIQIDKEAMALGYDVAKQALIDPPGDLYYYNETYANYKVIERHMGGVSQSIINSLTDGNDEFRATKTDGGTLNNSTFYQPVGQDQYRRIRFNDETTSPNFDTNGNYDNLTGKYKAPQSGYYHFHTEVEFANNHNGSESFAQQVELQRVSAGGDVIETESTFTTITYLSSFTFVLDRVFYLQEGETVEVWIKAPFNVSSGSIWYQQYVPFSEFGGIGSYGNGYSQVSVGTGGSANSTFFYCDELENGGGVVPASDPDEARLVVFEAEMSTTREQFDDILANPYAYYHTNYEPSGTKYRTGYIQRISRNMLSGETTIEQFKKHKGV